MRRILIFLLLFGFKGYSQTSISGSGPVTMQQIATVMYNLGELSTPTGPYTLAQLNAAAHLTANLTDHTPPYLIKEWWNYGPAAVTCGGGVAFPGGRAFPTTKIITLGSGTGTVTLDYNAQSIPDKFIVIFDGIEVINTGYRGNVAQQSALNAELASRGLPPETIQGVGLGQVSFTKSTATTTATVLVYGPMAGTAWTFTLGCPF